LLATDLRFYARVCQSREYLRVNSVWVIESLLSKLNQYQRIYIMFASPSHDYQGRTAFRQTSTNGRSHTLVNTGAVALALFVAVALLSPKFPQSSGLSPANIPRSSDFGISSVLGSLEVLAKDNFNGGAMPVNSGDCYSLYTPDGSRFGIEAYHISRSDEIQNVLPLPEGSYSVCVSSDRQSFDLSLPITAGRLTIVDPGIVETPAVPGQL
jgi:hypothetical protein